MGQEIRILIVDDSEDDAFFITKCLQSGGYEVVSERVDTAEAMRVALTEQDWDFITSDHAMPQFDARGTLEVGKEIRPDLPFIIISGEIDINLAVSLMKAGAQDYIQKREIIRLIPVVARILVESELLREKQQLDKDLLNSGVR